MKTLVCVIGFLFLSSCSLSPTSSSGDDIAFTYKTHFGLDCGMIFDCGYEIRVLEDGRIEYFEDKVDFVLVKEAAFGDLAKSELLELLNSYGFFQADQSWLKNDDLLGRGSAFLSYANLDTSSEKELTIPFEGEDIPENLAELRIELDRYLKGKLELD